MFCPLQVHEKVSSDLSVVPENEPLDSDTEAEKNLVERIKSIKQEKWGRFLHYFSIRHVTTSFSGLSFLQCPRHLFPLQRGSGVSTPRDGAGWFRPGEPGLWGLAELRESLGRAAALFCSQLRAWRSVLRYSLAFPSFYLFLSLTCGFLTRPRGRWVGPFLSFVVQVWTSDGDGRWRLLCNEAGWRNSNRVICVCVCVCLCAYVCTPIYACKCMCGTEACSNFIQIN